MELKGFSEFINEMSTVFRNNDVLCTVNPGFGRIEDSYFKHPERYDPLWSYTNGCILNFFNKHYKYLYNKLIKEF